MPFHLCSSSFILHLLSPLLYSTLQAKLHFGTRKGASLAALRAMKPRVSCHFPRFSPPPTATNVTNISSNCECGRRYWPVPSFLIYIYIYIYRSIYQALLIAARAHPNLYHLDSLISTRVPALCAHLLLHPNHDATPRPKADGSVRPRL